MTDAAHKQHVEVSGLKLDIVGGIAAYSDANRDHR